EEYRDDPRKAFKQSKLEEATAYLSYSLGEIAKVAALLGKKEDYVYFQKYSQGAKHAYQGLILAHGAPDTDRQAKLVRPLALDLADCETKKALEDRLAQSVINKDATIQTGFLSTGFILPVLQKAGHLDLAYRMLENEKAPSWLYEVDQGATTIWENWMASPNNKSDGVGSRNHYSPGAVCSWMFEGILGIIPDEKNHFILAPAPGGSLTHAEGSYLSVYGSVSSSWEKKGNGFNYHFVIPSNTTADLYLPGKEKAILEPGEYNF
ncbi:MAG: alfa-L-rhamnosidase, partial [Bacilli bacterium]|nr:alfa-L-rhamnosidase [Bacilli bacterium]